jgi:hypothetical protein
MQTRFEGATFPLRPKTVEGIIVGNAMAAPPNVRADFKKLLRVVFIQSLYLTKIITLPEVAFQ